jgi:hypothetical protein
MANGSGTLDDPWHLTTRLGTAKFDMHRDEEKNVPSGASFQQGCFTSLATPGTGVVVPPTFGMPSRVTINGAITFTFPFTLAGQDYR